MTVRDEDKQFIAQVYSYIFIGLMLDWIKDDMREDPAADRGSACQAHQRERPMLCGGSPVVPALILSFLPHLIKLLHSYVSVIKLLSRSVFLFIVSRDGKGYNEASKEKNETQQEVLIMYYSAGTYESFAHPEKPEGRGQKIGLYHRHRPCRPDGGILSGPRRADEGRAHPSAGKAGPGGRQLRRPQGRDQGLLHARRPRDGQPLRVSCGIPSAMSRPSRRRASPCWTSTIGSTSTTPTTRSAAPP